MEVSRRVLARLGRVYSIALVLGPDPGGPPSVAAGSEAEGPLLFFEAPDYKRRFIAGDPGGYISTWPLVSDDHRYLVASTDFKPGFAAENCRILVYDLDAGELPTPVELAHIPFTHRIALTEVGGKTCFLASTLCSYKDYKYDWTHPGGIYACPVPEPLHQPWQTHEVLGGLNKNHGMDRAEIEGRRGFLISAMEGLFFLQIPPKIEDPWPVETIAEGEHSDAFAFDWDGSGVPQVFAISPFHGNVLSLYRKEKGCWQGAVLNEDIEMGHVLWAGEFLGEPGLIVGGRGGRKEVALYRPSGDGGFTRHLIEAGLGPTQMAVVHPSSEEAWLFVAGHGKNQVILFQVTR